MLNWFKYKDRVYDLFLALWLVIWLLLLLLLAWLYSLHHFFDFVFNINSWLRLLVIIWVVVFLFILNYLRANLLTFTLFFIISSYFIEFQFNFQLFKIQFIFLFWIFQLRFFQHLHYLIDVIRTLLLLFLVLIIIISPAIIICVRVKFFVTTFPTLVLIKYIIWPFTYSTDLVLFWQANILFYCVNYIILTYNYELGILLDLANSFLAMFINLLIL